MLQQIKRIYERFEPVAAIIGAGISVYSVLASFYADIAGIDPLVLKAAVQRFADAEYAIPLLVLVTSACLVLFVAWDRRHITLRFGLLFTILFCVSALTFRSYVFATIGPKVKVALFDQIAAASCAGDYQRAIGIAEQVVQSKRLARFHRDANTYITYLQALLELKKYRETRAQEARPPFELAEDQILFGFSLSRDYARDYYSDTPGARKPAQCVKHIT